MAKTHMVSWNVMISGYVRDAGVKPDSVKHVFEAIRIFFDIRDAGVKPDSVTFTSILPAYSQLAALEQGKEIHKYVKENDSESDENVMGALLDMYAKCGTAEETCQVFDRLPVRNFVSWTSMNTAYGSHGQAFKALELYSRMQDSNAKPDKVTFLAIVSACSHAGLIDERCYFFNQMTASHGIKPTLEHYLYLIDLLGRAGRLHESYSIIQNTPSIQTNVDLLSTLFSAYNMHGDLELGEKIARLLIEEDPNDPSTYVTLSNMYDAFIGKRNEVHKVRLKMKELGLKKSLGCSWIEIDKTIHPLFVDDKSHPRADMLYVCLENEKDEIPLD